MTGVLLLQIPNLVRDDEGDFYTALREPQGPGVFVLRRDFFLFLADQYRAMEGDLATRRFPKGIYDPLKNPWRDFSRARQLQKQLPQKKIRSYCKTILSLVMEVFRIALKRLFRSSMVKLSFTVSYDAYFEKELYSGKGRRSKKKEAAFLEELGKVIDGIAKEHDACIIWDEPLTEERRA